MGKFIDPSASPTTSRINDAISGSYTVSGTDSYTVSADGTFDYTYLTGKAIDITVPNPNTGAATLDFDGLGVKDIEKWSGGSLVDVEAGDLIGTVRIRYDGTRWVMESGGSGGSSYTFTNGQTESGGTVKLGGSLIENTTIDLSHYNFHLLNGEEMRLSATTEVLLQSNGSSRIGYDAISGSSTFRGFGTDSNDVFIQLGSDAPGDTYHRNSSGRLARLAAGTDGDVLTMVSGMPAWAAPSGGGGTWGSITGTLSDQTDLQSALDAKLNLTGATYTTTTGNGLDITSSTVTSGNLVSITNTGTAAASDTKTALYVASSGANATSGQDTYAIRGINTNTGTTSVNYGGYFSATGGAVNYGLGIGGGNVQLNQAAAQTISKTGGIFSIGTADFNTLSLIVANTSRITINGSSGAFTFATNAVSAGSVTGYTFNDAARTNQTASTESHFMNFTPNSFQYATGTQTMLRTYRMNAATYSFVGASVIDDAYGLWVDKPTQGTNATITNNWAAGFNGNVQISGTRVNMANLPTSAAGLSAGDIWNNTGVINIV